MDSLEAKAFCFASVLRNEPETWGKAEAEAAAKVATALLNNKKIDIAVFAEIMPEVAGNHSATRQRFQAMGFIERKESDSALKRKIETAIKTIDAELDKLSE